MNKFDRPKRSLGQNFLVDQEYIDKIVSSLNLTEGEPIIEIGPGRGALTREILKTGANVTAIELDRNLAPALQAEFAEYTNLTVIEADALEIDFSLITNGKRSKLVANLPYNISTAILQRLIIQRECFSELVLMLQREVVDRITAKADESERGYLSVLVETYCETRKLFDVPGRAFRPIPRVWSSIVRLRMRENVVIENEKLLLQIVSCGFMQKRKTIFNNLKNLPQNSLVNVDMKVILDSCEIESTRRAETLEMSEWLKLTKEILAVSRN